MGGLESRYRIPTSRIVKPLNPVSCSKLQSRISLPLSSKIPNPGLQISQIPDPEKPIGDPRYMHSRFLTADYITSSSPEAAILVVSATDRDLFPARGLDPWRWPKGLQL